MTDTPTPLEESIRHRLHEQAADVPAPDAMRNRVLEALEEDVWATRRADRTRWNGNPRPFLMLAGVAAAIAMTFAVVALVNQGTETVEVITADPTIPVTTENQLQLDSARVQQAMAERSLEEVGAEWSLLSETDDVLSVGLVSSTEGDSSGILRIVTPPPGTSSDEVVASLSSTLFDTTVVDDSVGRIGGLETRVVRIETVGGTSRLGFRIAADTYIEASGIDRVFVVHMTTTHPEKVVFWVEASTAEIDEFEAAAGRLIESLASE